MSENIQATGSCLCGAVSISAETMSTDVGACHCSMCRKWGGGPLLVVECTGKVEISGEENVGRFSSSEWADRGFCKTCGTHLFYKLKEYPQYMIPVDLLNPNADLHFDHQIFIEEKPAYYSFAEKTKMMTGAEVFAQFSD